MAATLILHFDPSGGQPVAEVGLGVTHGSLVEHRPMLTVPCTNLDEFVKEIQSLRDELDKIENEARTNFALITKTEVRSP